ncbi:hypothetical protein M427DRAFT_59732 [Gonapodya prolifera JEL478]|uniref:Uncharacterized protein n=1 Tax=Gonapodya prolifera (strain JEL478) TaxID=1344416 RepID=A0A139A7A3_GONPJ|nr:hypothetical protein M427DRAFT_59732 [Gonapodya prolifera JEL478]|eukprot:KXS12223.1 hypothetical protein M427DRAFT_59732 [Gonapodya prolifera JEL478]
MPSPSVDPPDPSADEEDSDSFTSDSESGLSDSVASEDQRGLAIRKQADAKAKAKTLAKVEGRNGDSAVQTVKPELERRGTSDTDSHTSHPHDSSHSQSLRKRGPVPLVTSSARYRPTGPGPDLSDSTPSGVIPPIAVTITPPSTTESQPRRVSSATEHVGHADPTAAGAGAGGTSPILSQQPSLMFTSDLTSGARPITTILEGSRENFVGSGSGSGGDVWGGGGSGSGDVLVGNTASDHQSGTGGGLTLERPFPPIRLHTTPAISAIPAPKLVEMPQINSHAIPPPNPADIARSFLVASLGPTLAFQAFAVLFILSVDAGDSARGGGVPIVAAERRSAAPPWFAPRVLLATMPTPLNAKYAELYRAFDARGVVTHPARFPSFPDQHPTPNPSVPPWLIQTLAATRDRLAAAAADFNGAPPADIDVLRAAVEDEVREDLDAIHLAELPCRDLVALDLSRALPGGRPVLQLNATSGVFVFASPTVQLNREACNLLRVVTGTTRGTVDIAGGDYERTSGVDRNGAAEMAKKMEQTMQEYRTRIAGLESSLSSTLERTSSLAANFESLQVLSITLAEQLAAARSNNVDLARRIAELEHGADGMASKVTRLRGVLQDGVETWVARGEEVLFSELDAKLAKIHAPSLAARLAVSIRSLPSQLSHLPTHLASASRAIAGYITVAFGLLLQTVARVKDDLFSRYTAPPSEEGEADAASLRSRTSTDTNEAASGVVKGKKERRRKRRRGADLSVVVVSVLTSTFVLLIAFAIAKFLA